jgi:hypothetical protein
MDKIEIIQHAEQFIPKDLLYGFYNGQLFKQFLENNASRIVQDEDSYELVSKKVLEVIDQLIDRGVFTTASQYGNDYKELPIDDYINKLPYVGDIFITPTDKLNIAEELRNGRSYSTLLSNEYIKPSKLDKLEQIIRCTDDLSSIKEDYPEIARTSINGVPFENMLMTLPSLMDDTFKIDGIELDEYINKKYEEYSLVRYNSVDSKPVNVEQIKLTEDAKDVTSEYIFLTPEEVDELVQSSQEITNRSSLSQTIKNVINGIELAKTSKTLHAYDERIALIRDSISSTFKDDNLITELYQAMVSKYAKQENQLEWDEDNRDDVDMLFRSDLNDIKERLEQIEKDYYHTYENVDDRLLDLKYEFIDYKRKVEKMGLSMRHELDEVTEKFKALETIINYSRENLSHDMVRSQNDIEYTEMLMNVESRKTTTSLPEQTAIEIKIEKMDKDRVKKLEEYLQNGTITQEYYDKHMGNDKQRIAA